MKYLRVPLSKIGQLQCLGVELSREVTKIGIAEGV